MKRKNKLGFTLIELLVVITIIGILATGAVSVYTSQIQKARDSTRLSSIEAVKSGLEQFYQDKGEYPHSSSSSSDGDLAFSGVIIYTPKLPTDPKSGQKSKHSVFDYLYTVGKDDNEINGQDYELSTTFENKGNIDNKASKDGGDDNYRLEIGIDLMGNNTQINPETDRTDDKRTLQCVESSCNAEGTKLIIKGNP